MLSTGGKNIKLEENYLKVESKSSYNKNIFIKKGLNTI